MSSQKSSQFRLVPNFGLVQIRDIQTLQDFVVEMLTISCQAFFILQSSQKIMLYQYLEEN